MRGVSVGRAIMARAESIAAARGCIGAWLDTYSFQARGFYEKLGYSLVGTIEDCPPGGAHHLLQKRFG
jgi:GNAT superfamily N-acetyltransferase